MRKRLLCATMVLTLTAGLTACSSKPAEPTSTPAATTPAKEEAKTESFSAEYEMKGTTSSGKPKNDTFIFEGKTTDGVITELNFDIIRNKGTENEYSKKDIMGYLMNISDATVEKTESGFKLTKLTSYGFDEAYAEGTAAQFMVSATTDNLTEETKFKDLTFINDAASTPEAPVAVELDKAMIAFGYVAREAGVENFTEDTLVKDIISAHDFYKDGAFVEGSTRISYTGYNGGRSYGEQMEAIETHILENKMTLEQVYEMFKTENQPSTKVADRDAVTGATIAFVGDFQRMVYVAMHGELFEGVVTHSKDGDNTKVEVVTQGYAGEIETHVTFDKDGKITKVNVRDSQETPTIGGLLTAEDSDFIKALIDGQSDLDKVEAVSGASMTSKGLTNAVKHAVEYYNGL